MEHPMIIELRNEETGNVKKISHGINYCTNLWHNII